MFGKLVCCITRKHKRGKRVTIEKVPTDTIQAAIKKYGDAYYLGCPRCGAVWARPAKKAAG